MKKKRVVTKIPIEPFQLNQFTPGSLHLPGVEEVWTEGGEKWKSSFLIWKNHGYVDSGNLVVGYLELEQKKQKENQVEISFFEKRVHNGGRENIIEGTLLTDSSKKFRPLKWELISRFVTNKGKEIPYLNFHQKAEVEVDRVILTTNDKRTNKDISGELFHEFGLLRYLFDPNFSTSEVKSFLFLENGLISKSGHQINEAPELNQTLEDRQLRCLLQTGYGVNPIEYYLDKNNLLVAAISSFSAKIYNPDAAGFYNDFINKSFKKQKS